MPEIKDGFVQKNENFEKKQSFDLGPESSFAAIKKRYNEIDDEYQAEIRANSAFYNLLNVAKSKAKIMKLNEELYNLPDKFTDESGRIIQEDEWFRIKEREQGSLREYLEETEGDIYLDRSYEDYIKEAEEAQKALQAIDDKYEAEKQALEKTTRPINAVMIEARRKDEIADLWERVLRQVTSPAEREREIKRQTSELREKKQIIDDFLAFIEDKTPDQFYQWTKNDVYSAHAYLMKLREADLEDLWKLGSDRSQIEHVKREAYDHYTPREDKINAKYDQMLKELK